MRRFVATAIAVAALVAAGCGGDEGSSSPGGGGGGTLKIGAMNPYSGDFSLYGTELLRGYQLAVDEVNAKGGVDGRKVELLKGDASAADQAISQAQRLATQERVDAFTGTYISAVSQSASDVAAQQNKLYWETNALAADLTTRGLDNFLRVGPSANDFAAVSVEAMTPVAESIGASVDGLKVYVEHEESIYGTSIAKEQIRRLKDAGADVVGEGAHDATAADLTDSVLRAKSAKPDVWLITGYVPDINLLLRTAQQQGFEPGATVLTGTGDTNETLEAVGAKQLEGTFVVSYPRADISEDYGPGADAFLQAYEKKYGGEPRAPQTLTAYTGMKVLLDVLNQAGSADPKAVRDAAAGLDEPENSLPAGYGVKFDDRGQNMRAKPVVIQWQDGKQVTVFPEKAAGDHRIEKSRRPEGGAMDLVNVIVTGVLLGGIYALVSIGLTLIFGVIQVVNFAQGEFVMLGMYGAFYTHKWWGLDPYVSILVVGPATFLLGIVVQRLIIQPLLDEPVMQIFATFGLVILIQNSVLASTHGVPRTTRTGYSASVLDAGFATISVPRLVVLVFTVAVAVALLAFLRRSMLGTAIRAVAHDRMAARLMGIDVERVYMLTFGLGVALAAVAGAMLAPIYTVTPSIGFNFILPAFAVVILGGLGSIQGALLGGLVVGLVESFSGFYLDPSLKQAIWFALFIAVLVVRPNGLLGGATTGAPVAVR